MCWVGLSIRPVLRPRPRLHSKHLHVIYWGQKKTRHWHTFDLFIFTVSLRQHDGSQARLVHSYKVWIFTPAFLCGVCIFAACVFFSGFYVFVKSRVSNVFSVLTTPHLWFPSEGLDIRIPLLYCCILTIDPVFHYYNVHLIFVLFFLHQRCE